MRPLRVWVISDLHLGPGTALTNFRDARALAGFFDHLAADDRPSEVVLAGDTFDFLQCSGYHGFDPNLAVKHLQQILTNPATTAVLQALTRYGRKSSHDITILAGNHDPELLLSDVQSHVADHIERAGSVYFADEVLVPGEGTRWPVWGRELGDPGQPVWVVHGDRWDPHNAIQHDEVRERVARGQTVELPVGSHLVFEVLSRLKVGHRWVDELKPEFASVLPLLLYLDAPLTMRFLAQHPRISGGLLMGEIRGRLRAGALFGGDVATTESEDIVGVLADDLASVLTEVPEGRREAALSALERWLEGGPESDRGEHTLASHTNPGRWLIRAWLAHIRKTDRFLRLDADDGVAAHMRRTVPAHVHTVIAGHTHGPRRHLDQRPRYLNTGTWVPVAQIPDGDIRIWIDMLDENRGWPSTAPRTVAYVDLGGAEPAVKLMFVDETGVPCEVP